AEVQPPVDPQAALLDCLRDDLAEQHLLAEVLRADHDAVAGVTTDQHERQQDEPPHRAPLRRRSKRLARAPMPKSAAIAIAAAGTAPARISRSSTIETPRKM